MGGPGPRRRQAPHTLCAITGRSRADPLGHLPARTGHSIATYCQVDKDWGCGAKAVPESPAELVTPHPRGHREVPQPGDARLDHELWQLPPLFRATADGPHHKPAVSNARGVEAGGEVAGEIELAIGLSRSQDCRCPSMSLSPLAAYAAGRGKDCGQLAP